MTEEIEALRNLMADLDEEKLLAAVKEQLDAKTAPMAIIEACRFGMQDVGERFGKGDYFVCDLVASAEIFNEVMQLIGPELTSEANDSNKVKIVFGTVQGDIHNIGKDIVISMLRCNGFEVYDLGVDVPPQAFVDKVRETGAKIVGLSGLLTLAFSNMGVTVKALRSAGLGDDLKVMIGGGMMDDFVCQKVEADGWGHDAVEAVNLAKSFAEAGKK